MGDYYICHSDDDYVSHHGVLGMKWGVRKYQNPDGSLTAAGKSRYGYGSSGGVSSGASGKKRRSKIRRIAESRTHGKKLSKHTQRVLDDYDNLSDDEFANKYKTSKKRYMHRVKKYGDPYKNAPLPKLARNETFKKFSNTAYDLTPDWYKKAVINHIQKSSKHWAGKKKSK